MTALPGTPAIQNAIPMPFFSTTPFAAPGLGVVAGLVMAGLGLGWLGRRAAVARGRGEGFGLPPPSPADIPLKRVREQSQGEGFDVMEIPTPEAKAEERSPPGIVVALAPILIVVSLNYLFAEVLLPRLDLSYLRTAEFGATDPQAVIGIWAIISALVLSSLAVIAMNWSRIRRIVQVIDDGANASVAPIFNTASLVGLGAVIASLPAFEALRDAILGVAPGNPLVSLSIAVNVLAGITGSASGGMSIALETLGARYLELGLAAGIAPEVLHRVTAVATGGLDALPHNGAVVTLLTICGLTHRESYLDIFMVAVAGPLAALATLVVLATVFGAF